jgi:hypothetical protein
MDVDYDLPFMQWAGVHKNDDFICVEPLSGYRRTLQEDDGFAIYLEPDATEEALGQALLEALNRSRFLYPNQNRAFFQAERIVNNIKRWTTQVMKRFRYKTKREMYKNMGYCWIMRTGGTISIEPHKYEKPEYWHNFPKDQTVVIPETTDPLVAGAALKLALERCA